MKSLRIIPLLLAALTPLGCSNTDSAELGTGEIEAAMHVDVSDDDGSKAWVALTEGFNDVILSEGDRLTGRTGNGEELTFELHDNFDFYETPLPDDVAELTIEPEIGKIYRNSRVTKVLEFGAFVEILADDARAPRCEGLIHISGARRAWNAC